MVVRLNVLWERQKKKKSLHFLGILVVLMNVLIFQLLIQTLTALSLKEQKEKKKKKKDLLPLNWGGFLKGIYLVFSDGRKPFENKFRTGNLAIFLTSAYVPMSCLQSDQLHWNVYQDVQQKLLNVI